MNTLIARARRRAAAHPVAASAAGLLQALSEITPSADPATVAREVEGGLVALEILLEHGNPELGAESAPPPGGSKPSTRPSLARETGQRARKNRGLVVERASGAERRQAFAEHAARRYVSPVPWRGATLEALELQSAAARERSEKLSAVRAEEASRAASRAISRAVERSKNGRRLRERSARW